MTTRWSLKNPRNYTGGFLTFQLKFSFHIHHFVYGAKLPIIIYDNLFIHFFLSFNEVENDLWQLPRHSVEVMVTLHGESTSHRWWNLTLDNRTVLEI